MKDREIRLAIGSLLHDIGKIVYRSGDGRNHSQSGYEYLKTEAGIEDKDILNCVRFHHACNLKSSVLEGNDLAYLTYFADNIAAAADRRESLEAEDGFDKQMPLASIFNLLNGNCGSSHFAHQILDIKNGINYPTEKSILMDEQFYGKIVRNVTDNLKGIEITEEYLNSLLTVLEANLTYIPSSTSRREQADISLFDHLKITAAIAQCLEQYFSERGITDYRRAVMNEAKEHYASKMFLLYSMDISGIQKFIYSVGSRGALRGLRARSFYLEIVMEHIIDELLTAMDLSRANLIYSGGGHSYLLLPNTEEVKQKLAVYEKRINQWFMKYFGISLYIAGGYAACSANDLKNEPKGSYSGLYMQISKIIVGKKSHRYSADEILMMNSRKENTGERECKVCRRMAKLNEEEKCPVCSSLERMSGGILHRDFYIVLTEQKEDALPLPEERYLLAVSKEELLKWMDTDQYVRCYTKNNVFTGRHVTTKLWVGDYSTGDTFEQFAEKAEGIKRIGVLRADVDNLGTAFVRGFVRENGDERYVSLSRTATLSRQLSLFFKCYINQILEKGANGSLGSVGKRNAAIVYSGGDDVFLVGAWNDVIEAFIDLKLSFEKFTQNTITISGGIGVYPAKYPVNIMAEEVAELEEYSKHMDGKNAVTVFAEGHTYGWDIFLEKVIGEKLKIIRDFFEISEDRGKAFLYHILELLRNEEGRFNRARYVYLLSRMEPEEEDGRQQREAYRLFSRKMYQWAGDEEERRELITAIYLYVYGTREKEER